LQEHEHNSKSSLQEHDHNGVVIARAEL
jgi:hypothetical protein